MTEKTEMTDSHLAKAKIAEQAERYDDMAKVRSDWASHKEKAEEWHMLTL